MIYVYNRIVDADDLEIEYMGIDYRLTGKNHMGKVDYYSYTCPGAEPLLVTPIFAKQFLTAVKKVTRVLNATKAATVKARLEAVFGKAPEEEVYDYGDSQIYHYAMDYRDIRLTMQLENGKLTIEPSFTIVKGTILGNYIHVDMSENEELQALL